VVIIPVATPLATLGQLGAVAPGGKPVPTRCFDGGSKQTRTADPLLVRQVL
jgi:hypothetical protein